MPSYLGSDGTRLYYNESRAAADGDSAPLIALAGGAGRDPSYLGDLAGRGASRRLILPHLRGVGRSPLPADVELASFWRQANDVECLRVHLGLERVLLLGHSAGTRLAISYAAQYPERLAGMVLVTPPASYLVDVPSDVDQLLDKRRGEAAFDAALAAWSAGPQDTSHAGFNDWCQHVAPLGYAAWDATAQAHALIGETNFAANRAFFGVDPPADLAARLGQVSAPVLVMAGAQDCITGVAQVVAVAQLFSAGSAVVVERCGHYPWVERPTEFRHEVDSFLTRV